MPAINVVAEKHYAWALPIAAGIATNRNGVPWGYLGSVNDVFKSPSSDRDQSMAFAHPEVSGGAFTYTAIHEASHYLGLAHPHDSIGATRNADGSPRYYDGFTWAYNSTASPTNSFEHPRPGAPEDRLQQLFLRAEVVVHKAVGDPCLACDVRNAARVVAVVCKDRDRRP